MRCSPPAVASLVVLFAASAAVAGSRSNLRDGSTPDSSSTADQAALEAPRRAAGAVISKTLHYAQLAAWQLDQSISDEGKGSARRAFGFVLELASPRGNLLSAIVSDDTSVLDNRPVQLGELSSGFGLRRDPKNRRRRQRHKGIDIRAPRHTPVYAAGSGVVTKASRQRGYGRVIYIDHGDGLQTRYAHLQRISVTKGDFVAGSALIGTVGSSGRTTGPHLHFEVRRDGEAVSPEALLGLGLIDGQPTLTERVAHLLVDPPQTLERETSDRAARKLERKRKARKRKAKKGRKNRRKRELRSRRPSS